MSDAPARPVRYRHYKGGVYEVICTARLESDHTEMVVYRGADGATWVRPKDVFLECVDVGGTLVPRFSPIDL